MEEEADVHEFVPWSHLSLAQASRWPRVAGAIFSLGVVVALVSQLVVNQRDLPALPTTSTVAVEEPSLLSEEDLQPIELDGATSAAEEFVIDYFTRSGDRPTYVEWARSTHTERESEGLTIFVRYRILVGDPYLRMPVRESAVTLRPAENTWIVVGLPTDEAASPLKHEVQAGTVAENEFGFRVAP